LVAETLSLAKIPVISNEGLLLSKSDKVNALIALLRYLKNPKDAISKSVISAYLFTHILSDENLHTLNLKVKTEAGFNEVLKKANIFINPEKLLQEPLYEMVEQLIRLFKFDNN
jgi:ATP-dependent exoDNAse (exonuclease V) beta subunit